ncbi:ACT domain-containing protein ACR10 isoform X2 [Amborella trichopoda]|nr:ACT domain-containing protein ACR10 isoform X2 [Amborella trichopoda]|eukprot:XP_011625901.1 ACT domain-containing protein ACR10 isoform X2 [Amborella trichopoda]
MGITCDDVVLIRHAQNEGDPTIVTVNCPDKTGLGCDLCRIILQFSLSIVRGDISTDGKWCYIVLWVVSRPGHAVRWSNLKKRLISACPSCSSAASLYCSPSLEASPKPPQVYLLKFSSPNRSGLLHDVTEVLCELELTIKRVKVSTTPDGNVMDLFFITDTRELMHTKKRQLDTCEQLRAVLGESVIQCEIEPADPEMGGHQCSSFILPAIPDELLNVDDEEPSPLDKLNHLSVTVDNSLRPSHTLIQILCRDHKGLLYDIMRTLKDYNIQISYGRFSARWKQLCEVDLFVMQADGKKVVDAEKQNALCSRLRSELLHPLRVMVVGRGPDTELLVANPVELSGKG